MVPKPEDEEEEEETDQIGEVIGGVVETVVDNTQNTIEALQGLIASIGDLVPQIPGLPAQALDMLCVAVFGSKAHLIERSLAESLLGSRGTYALQQNTGGRDFSWVNSRKSSSCQSPPKSPSKKLACNDSLNKIAGTASSRWESVLSLTSSRNTASRRLSPSKRSSVTRDGASKTMKDALLSLELMSSPDFGVAPPPVKEETGSDEEPEPRFTRVRCPLDFEALASAIAKFDQAALEGQPRSCLALLDARGVLRESWVPEWPQWLIRLQPTGPIARQLANV